METTIKPPPGMTRVTRRTTSKDADGRVVQVLSEELAPPAITIVRVPRTEPAEWEHEREALRVRLAALEMALQTRMPTPVPTPPPRVVISGAAFSCWRRVIQPIVMAASGAAREVSVDFAQLDRELGDGLTSSPDVRRRVLEDLAREAREDASFWQDHPEIRVLRFHEASTAALPEPTRLPSRAEPAPAARIATPIGFIRP